MSNDVKWIKITTDMFDDEKIRIIEKMPDGDTILIIWIKLLTLAGRVNAGGYILLTESIPYTEETLATIFDRPLMTIQLALRTFDLYSMIHLDNGAVVVSNWDKHQNAEGLERIKEQTRLRVERHRKHRSNVTSALQVTQGNAVEQEIEQDKETEGSSSNCFSLYEANIGRLTPVVADNLKSMLEDYSEEDICKAITTSVQAGVKTLRYIEGVLKRKDGPHIPRNGLGSEDPDKFIKGRYGHMVQR